MVPEINEVLHVFSRNEKGTLDTNTALDAISIFAPVNTEDITKLINGREVDVTIFNEVVNSLKAKIPDEDYIKDLLKRINPSGSDTINRNTIEYILKTSYKIPTNKIQSFFKSIGIDPNQESVNIDNLAKKLVSQLD